MWPIHAPAPTGSTPEAFAVTAKSSHKKSPDQNGTGLSDRLPPGRKVNRSVLTWQRKRQQLRHQQQRRLQQREQQPELLRKQERQEPGLPQRREREQERVLPSCRKQRGQQQRSGQPERESSSFQFFLLDRRILKLPSRADLLQRCVMAEGTPQGRIAFTPARNYRDVSSILTNTDTWRTLLHHHLYRWFAQGAATNPAWTPENPGRCDATATR